MKRRAYERDDSIASFTIRQLSELERRIYGFEDAIETYRNFLANVPEHTLVWNDITDELNITIVELDNLKQSYQVELNYLLFLKEMDENNIIQLQKILTFEWLNDTERDIFQKGLHDSIRTVEQIERYIPERRIRYEPFSNTEIFEE